MRFCLLCLRPLPRRRWWQLIAPRMSLCPSRDAEACMAAQSALVETRVDQWHEIDSEWDPEAEQWHHRCVRCGARTTGDMPVLPCKAVNP